MGTQHLSQRAFAARFGFDTRRLAELVAEGLPLTADKKVDLAEGKAWLERYNTPSIPSGYTSKGLRTVADRRAHKLERESALLDLTLQERRGGLVERRAVESAIVARAMFERDSWLGW